MTGFQTMFESNDLHSGNFYGEAVLPLKIVILNKNYVILKFK